MSDRKVVLLADDDPDRGLLLHEALSMANLRARVHHVHGGRDALRYLRRQPPFEQAERPHLVLLDIHMPDLDGFGVMESLREDPIDAAPPVIVTSASIHPGDRERARALGCAAYVPKVVDLRQFSSAIARVAAAWLAP